MTQPDAVIAQEMEAEKAVIGACLAENSSMELVADYLKPADFYNEQHRTIYGAMLDLWREGAPASERAVTDYLRERGELRLAGGAAGISFIAGELPDVSNVEYYAKEVKDASTTRAIQGLGVFLKNVESSPQDALSAALRRVIDISADSLRSVPEQIGDHTARVYRRAIQLHNKEIEDKSIMSGFPRLDAITGGFKASDMIVIAARPSVGKSALGIDLCKSVASRGERVLFISLEMSSQQIATRMMAAESGVPYSRIQAGYLMQKDPELLAEANKKFINLPLVVDDRSSQTITDIQVKARREMARGGLSMVVVDYLQIAAKDSTDFAQVTRVSNGLKAMAKDLSIPVVALAQLNRGVELRDSREPVLSDLKQSGAIEQDADVVILLWYRHLARMNELELKVAKQRNGPLGRVTLDFNKDTQTFTEIGGGGENVD